LKLRLLAITVLLYLLGTAEAGGQNLASLRLSHPTRLQVVGPSPVAYETEVPPGVTPVYYNSEGRRLLAWLVLPRGGRSARHPAVLYLHQNFALTAQVWEDARPFVEAGFVVLMPSYRGENGNPGAFERYFGEVDDAAAALEYLRNLRQVDPRYLYAAGDTMGGTSALLLAESGAGLRRVAACSPFPDISDAIRHGLSPQGWLFPYNWSSDTENSLRSPGRHLDLLNCPAEIYNSSRDPLYQRQAAALPTEAQKYHKQLSCHVFPNTDQRSVVRPAIRAMVAVFLEDCSAR
jgi:dipeptidyl aminopeptidase/acylaminoacyl peptidase